MRKLTHVTLIGGTIYPVGTTENEIDDMNDGQLQSLISTGGLVEADADPGPDVLSDDVTPEPAKPKRSRRKTA